MIFKITRAEFLRIEIQDNNKIYWMRVNGEYNIGYRFNTDSHYVDLIDHTKYPLIKIMRSSEYEYMLQKLGSIIYDK